MIGKGFSKSIIKNVIDKRRRLRGAVVMLVVVALLLGTMAPAGYASSDMPFARETLPTAPLGEMADATALPEGASASWWATVQEAIRQSEYNIAWQDHTYLWDVSAAYQAPNRAQNLRTYFAPSGIRLVPRTDVTPTWELGLTLTGYGYTGETQPVAAAELAANGNRIEYRRGDVSEWYVNDERGLEQGFTIPCPPSPTSTELGSEELVLELAVSGDLSPALTDGGQAIEFTTPAGVRVLRYSDLHVTDAGDRQLPASLTLSMSHISIQVDDSSAIYPIKVDPLLTAPSWTAESNQYFAYFGWSVGTAGDVNGDGYADVIVGAPYYDSGESAEGRAFVYHGSAGGLSTSPAWTAESNLESAYFGVSVGTAGDVNGDGYADVIVGAHHYGIGHEGWAFVYHGSASGLSTSVNWWAESNQAGAYFGHSVATAGDVNGDGYADVIVGAYSYDGGYELMDAGRAYVYHGSVIGLSWAPDWTAEGNQDYANFGHAVGTAGDVNGDGYADVVVGAPFYDHGQTNEGEAFLYHGSATGLSTIANWWGEGNQEDANFGRSVATAGDVNGDGYADVIVGAYAYDSGESGEGRAYVYPGSASGLSWAPFWMAESNQVGAYFGYSVGTAGDVNGDGYADVIVGAYAYDNGESSEGRAYVYHGSDSGLSTSPGWTAESNQEHAHFGRSVATAGDVNGDGYADVIVGAIMYDGGQSEEGRAYVYHGSAGGPSTAPGWTAESNQENAYFGWSVGTAGDVNGDGYADVIVGAYAYDKGQADEGRAYVYHGSDTGPSTIANWWAESNQENAHFGGSVGTAGDVNGDGYADVIIGAYGYDNGEADEGRAFVYHGSASGVSWGAPNWTAESNQDSARFGHSVGTAGDVNGDGYADVIVGAPYYDSGESNEGRAYVYYGSAGGLSAKFGWTAESNQLNAHFGRSVGTAGDVNGDGYSDVIIRALYYDNPETDEGRAYVYHGSTAGLSKMADWTAERDQEDAYFGRSVGTAGDVNGDGYADVIVGAPYYDNVQTDEGGPTFTTALPKV